MSYVLNNTPTGDSYPDVNTVPPIAFLAAGTSARFNIDVYNAAVFYQLGYGIGGATWGKEVFLPPTFRSLERIADAIRFRSAVPGTPAFVTCEALTAHELDQGDG